jgi:hypothetical protein
MSQRQDRPGDTFSSNAVRLSIREWCVVLAVLALTVSLIGSTWQRMERFDPSVDYRIPYGLTEDYWFFDRYCGLTSSADKTLVFGDSFIWGQYVEKEESLTHFLNQQAGSERFVNAGLDGAHPMALGGLIEHYCSDMRDGEVILHLNFLWLSSPQADLQAERDFRFNHPHLVPQFMPRIPSYGESVSGRIGIVLARYFPVFDWVRHLQKAYFESADLARWTLEHPYDNPLSQVTFDLPESEDNTHPDAQAWSVRTRTQQELPWVSLEGSLQWQAFQRLVDLLRTRGNKVFIVIGPLNEHMLSPANAEVYRGILNEAGAWLTENDIAFFLPHMLSSDLYADLSHPLSQGYALLAEEIWRQMSGQ